MSSNNVNSNDTTIEQNNKEIEKFLIDQHNHNQQLQQQQNQQSVNILNSKSNASPASQLNEQTSQITSPTNLPYIIQNGNIYQLTTSSSSTGQINPSNLIQISADNLRSNSVKLTAIKNGNFLNINPNKRIIIKTNSSDASQASQIVSAISPNSLANQKINIATQLNQQNQNQIKAINLFSQSANLNQTKQIIITNNQQNKTNQSQLQSQQAQQPIQQSQQAQITTSQNGSSIIVLAPSNRPLNEQNLQFLIQQRNSNNLNLNSSSSNIQQLKSSNLQQKIFVPSTGCVNLIKRAQFTTTSLPNSTNNKNENETSNNLKNNNNNIQYSVIANDSTQTSINDLNGKSTSLQSNNTNSNLINLLNSNKTLLSEQAILNKPKPNLEKEEASTTNITNNTNSNKQILSSNLINLNQSTNATNVTKIQTNNNTNKANISNNSQKLIYNRPQKEIATITPIASNQNKVFNQSNCTTTSAASNNITNVANNNINNNNANNNLTTSIQNGSLSQPSPNQAAKQSTPNLTTEIKSQIEQNDVVNEAILNECILPDTRIFASLLNKDHNLPSPSPSNPSQKNDIKFKTVLIGNTEHVILDNLQNLSDFKGNFSDLKNLACTVADHLNKSVSIPAFLLIESKPSVDKIKSILNEININPIIIDTCASVQQPAPQNEIKPSLAESNSNREKFNQQHQTLIKKLSSNESEPLLNNSQNSQIIATQNSNPVINNQNNNIASNDPTKKKISTPKRRATKPKKTQIIVNATGQTQVNKSKLTINDLIQQNALIVNQEIEKSNEPLAKKIKTINQLCNQTANQPISIEQVQMQTQQTTQLQNHSQPQLQPQSQSQPEQLNQTQTPVQQIQSQMSQPIVNQNSNQNNEIHQQTNQQKGLAYENLSQNQTNIDWLDQQIQLASEFIDTLYKNIPDDGQQTNSTTNNSTNIQNNIHHQENINSEQQLAQVKIEHDVSKINENFIKTEPITNHTQIEQQHQQQTHTQLNPGTTNQMNSNLQNHLGTSTNDYAFDLDPFDTNLFFTTNLNDIEF